MATVVVLHSVLGVRAGVLDAAARLRQAGHEVVVPDLFEGRTFDDYDVAMAYAENDVGHPRLMRNALAAVADVPDGMVVLGFSLGCVVAAHVATRRPVSGVVMVAGAIPASAFGDGRTWPSQMPVQVHNAEGDPFREHQMIDALESGVVAAGGSVAAYDYAGSGHLFTDRSRAEEFDPDATELLWRRVLEFVAAPPA